MTLDDGRLFIPAPEAAALLGIHVQTARAAIIAGQIPGRKFGRWWFVPAEWIRRAAELNGAGPPGPATADSITAAPSPPRGRAASG